MFGIELIDNLLFINSEELKNFIVSNKIIGTCIGVIMAYAATDVIKSIIGDILLPAFTLILYYIILGPIFKMKPAKEYKLNVFAFLKSLFSFTLILIVTYIIIKYIVMNWFGISYMQPAQ